MKKVILFGAVISTLFSCNRKEEVVNQINELNVTGTYDIIAFKANTKQDSTIVGSLRALVSEIQKARPGKDSDSIALLRDVKLDASALYNRFTSNNPSLESIATENFKTLAGNATTGLFKDIADASGQDYILINPVPDNVNGGRFGGDAGYLFNEYGIDIEEYFVKNYFGCMYNKVFTDYLTSDKVTLANVDRALVLYGAPTSFPNGLTISSNGITYTDVFSAQYAARRDNSNGNDNGGFYTTIKLNFIRLQNALKASPINNQERDAAIIAIRENWEKAMAATVINYCWSASGQFSKAAPTEAELSLGFHALGEALGLLSGMKGISATRIINNSQLDQCLDKLYANNPTKENNPIKLKSSVTEVSRLNEVVGILQNVYGFTGNQVNTYFKINDVSRRNVGFRVEE